MGVDMFPSVANPTTDDRIGAENADQQLNLILGLRGVRIERGMSVTEVAEKMGVDPAQVSRFESGSTNPTMVTIRRYAKAVRAVFRVEVNTYEADKAARVRQAANFHTVRVTHAALNAPEADDGPVLAPHIRYTTTTA